MNDHRAQEFPFIAEALAIDISNSLSAMQTGIRGFRNKKFLQRVLGGMNSKNEELISQILSDSYTSQKAVCEYLFQVAQTEVHTQKGLMRVTENLLHVIDRVEKIDKKLDLALGAFKNKIEEVYTELRGQIERLEAVVKKNEVFQFVSVKYKNGDLHKGFSPILRAALFNGFVCNLYAGDKSEVSRMKVDVSVDLMKESLSTDNDSESIITLVSKTVTLVENDTLPKAIYITGNGNSSILKTLNILFLKRDNGLAVTDSVIEETLKITQVFENDSFLETGHIFTSHEVAQQIAKDLIEF